MSLVNTTLALLAAVAVAATIALWPASETDKARADGEQLGQAVTQLHDAQSASEVDAALAELDAAVRETREHAGDEVADQVDAQADALARAADGFAGSLTSSDELEIALYEAELELALDDLTSQAEDFRTEGPEVQQAFWEGYEEGVTTA